MVNNVADKWRDLGVQLLRPDQENMLDIIAADHPHDVVRCCKCVLKKWLDTATDATWNKLIRVLRSPSVQLDYLASQLEQMMITECKTIEAPCNLMNQSLSSVVLWPTYTDVHNLYTVAYQEVCRDLLL